MISPSNFPFLKELECESEDSDTAAVAGLATAAVLALLLLLLGVYCWRKRPWSLSRFKRKEKKRLSVGPNFTGNKKDIKVNCLWFLTQCVRYTFYLHKPSFYALFSCLLFKLSRHTASCLACFIYNSL